MIECARRPARVMETAAAAAVSLRRSDGTDMDWQPINPVGAAPSLSADDLHLWWWPHAAQPAAARRAHVDGLLRATLAPYLGCAPEVLRFGREARGRPFLRHAGAPDFNLSDTAGGSIVAICAAPGRVGIDLERSARAPSVFALARRWFAPEEAAAMAAMDAEQARRAFLRLWTAKEAACKATGTGIFDHRLAAWRFDVQADPPRPLALPPEAGASAQWVFLRMAPSPAHTAAVACRGFTPRPQGFVVCAA